MATPTPFTISDEEFRTFHTIDRELYERLVSNIQLEPIESMQIMALWLWFEKLGYPNIIFKMLSLTDEYVKTVAEEAVYCIKILSSPVLSVSTNINIPMTQILLEKTISLQFIHDNKNLAILGIAKIINEVCLKAFNDIAEEAMEKALSARNLNAGNYQDQQGGSSSSSTVARVANPIMYPTIPLLSHGLVRPVYQHPVIGLSPLTLQVVGSNLNPQAEPFNPSIQAPAPIPIPAPTVPIPAPAPAAPAPAANEVPQSERTMFVTFSRGYPMTDEEVVTFFTRRYGDCIEEIHMQQVQAHEQVLFARIIFFESMKITEILNGNERVKFVINGKHVWARRFEARQGRRGAAAN